MWYTGDSIREGPEVLEYVVLYGHTDRSRTQPSLHSSLTNTNNHITGVVAYGVAFGEL